MDELRQQIKLFDVPEKSRSKSKRNAVEEPPTVTPESQLQLTRYLNLGVHRLALRGTRKVILALESRISELSELLRELWREIHRLAAGFDQLELEKREARTSNSDEARNPTAVLTERLQGRIAELAEQLDEKLRCDSDKPLVLAELLTAKPATLQSLPNLIRRAARKLILTSQKGDDSLELLIPKDVKPEAVLQHLKHAVEVAHPLLLPCGGAKRLVLLVPQGIDVEAPQLIIEKGMEESVSVGHNNIGEVILCCEVEQMPLPYVAVSLIEGRPDYAQVASRLHTRSDITWRPWG